MSIVNILTKTQGSQQAVDPHGFHFYLNRKLDKAAYWRCTTKDSSMQLISLNSSSKLVAETLPHHEHTTNFLKQKAKTMEKTIIKKNARTES